MATIPETATTDEVIREIRRIKENLAAEFDFDVDRIVADAQAKQKERQKAGRVVLPPPVVTAVDVAR